MLQIERARAAANPGMADGQPPIIDVAPLDVYYEPGPSEQQGSGWSSAQPQQQQMGFDGGMASDAPYGAWDGSSGAGSSTTTTSGGARWDPSLMDNGLDGGPASQGTEWGWGGPATDAGHGTGSDDARRSQGFAAQAR